MVSYFDIAVSVAIIFVIVFIWIVIVLRRGVLNNSSDPSPGVSAHLEILEKLKEQAIYETDDGSVKINRKLLAKLVYEAILDGMWTP